MIVPMLQNQPNPLLPNKLKRVSLIGLYWSLGSSPFLPPQMRPVLTRKLQGQQIECAVCGVAQARYVPVVSSWLQDRVGKDCLIIQSASWP